MNTIELRAAGTKLEALHGRFARCFRRSECQEHARGYLNGLLLLDGRKSIEPMALAFGKINLHGPRATVLAWQRFITVSPWEAQDVQYELQAVFNEEFVPAAAQSPLGTVGVIDGSGFAKRGDESVGVQRQWNGRLGKRDNCQVGVFLVGVTPAGSALLDHQLYLPKSWAGDAARRKKTRVPEDITFQTKPQIAASLLARSKVRFDWVLADEEFGRNGDFLDALESNPQCQRYLMEIPCNLTAWSSPPTRTTPDDSVRSVKAIADSLPPTAWRTIVLGEGTKGPLAFQFARLRVWSVRHRRAGPEAWLMIRRSLDAKPEVKYYFSNAEEAMPLETMALASGARWRVEEFFEDSKSHLGMADYEARSWTSWHHHMSLVALAHLFVTQTRRELRRDVPELTLDMALRLVGAALGRPQLSVDDACDLIDYHLARNRQAQLSHRKTWLAKHPNVVQNE